MTEYRIQFDTYGKTSRAQPDYIPAIGVGDELMFNTNSPAPLISMSANLLVDYDEDGLTDAFSINHYSERFGWDYDGIFYYKGLDNSEKGIKTRFHSRLHYHPLNAATDSLVPISLRYNWVKPVKWDSDNLLDLLLVSVRHPHFSFLKNTGKDKNGLPILREVKQYSARPIIENSYIPAVDAQDIDGDGDIDLLGIRTLNPTSIRPILVYFYKNIGPDANGIPELSEPIMLKTTDGDSVFCMASAYNLSFGDVDMDGKIDIIGNNQYLKPATVFLFKNMGGNIPVFQKMGNFEDIPADQKGYRWAQWQDREGLMSDDENILFKRSIKDGKPHFSQDGSLSHVNGPLVGGHQEKPEWKDWDEDGDMDLLAGEAWGRIHLYENTGTDEYPKFEAPRWIEANGKTIRIYRDGVFGGQHWHGAMGYPSVACVDWNEDGLFDMVVPNETNRVFWFQNIGTKGNPKFGEQKQILPDGYTDSKELLEKTRLKTIDDTYPKEKASPFYFRTRLALADYTGDGLTDIIGLNGVKNLVLYERYKNEAGELALKKGQQLYFNNGSPILEDGNKYVKIRDCDWDGDGLFDIIMTQNLFGNKYSLYVLKNVGSKTKPVFKRPEVLKRWGEPIIFSDHGFQPSVIDWDKDGRPDFVGCSESGYYVFFRHSVLTQPKPKIKLSSAKKLNENKN
uniref:FG-GAP repeat domain-containing protein n=1 Tax=uncultured Draconibacterium sp. TaxID=1573823 RepID=UPI00321767A3